MKDSFEIKPLDDETTISIDNAVMSMIGIQCDLEQLIDGEIYTVTLSELLFDMQEAAQVDVENAKTEIAEYKACKKQETIKLNSLEENFRAKKIQFEKVCDQNKKAGYYIRLLKEEASKVMSGKQSDLVIDPIASNRTGIYQFTKTSFEEWRNNFIKGVKVNKQNSITEKTKDNKKPLSNINWEDVTIKLLKNNRISYSYEKDHYSSTSFIDLGLIGKRKTEPNDLGKLFIKLAEGQRVPEGHKTNNAVSAKISKLGKILEGAIGIDKKPFKTFNPSDGYLSRFTLIDDRRNAEDRAKKHGSHEGFLEDKRYEPHPDMADIFNRGIQDPLDNLLGQEEGQSDDYDRDDLSWYDKD